VKVNCAAIPRELIESELFGHERGAFTGAQAKKRGFFEQAHAATLFLDEIGDMDVVAQAKVLRALQSGEISRVGSEHVMQRRRPCAGGHQQGSGKEVERGGFREDLFFRLNVFPSAAPRLRERVDDIRCSQRPSCRAFEGKRPPRGKPMDAEVPSTRSWRAAGRATSAS